MRRSSSGARVSDSGGGVSGSEAALPTYDPLSAAGRREAARTQALGRAVHCIPVVLLVCALLLWLSSSSHTHLGKVQTPLALERSSLSPKSQLGLLAAAMVNWRFPRGR